MAESLAASGTQLVTVALRRVHTNGAGMTRFFPVSIPTVIVCCRIPRVCVMRKKRCLPPNWLAKRGNQLAEAGDSSGSEVPDARSAGNAESRAGAGTAWLCAAVCACRSVLCRQLEEAGCAAVMPLAAPIGSNRGLESRAFLEIIIAQSKVPVVIDAGLGTSRMRRRPWSWGPMRCWSTWRLPPRPVR